MAEKQVVWKDDRKASMKERCSGMALEHYLALRLDYCSVQQRGRE